MMSYIMTTTTFKKLNINKSYLYILNFFTTPVLRQLKCYNKMNDKKKLITFHNVDTKVIFVF